MKQWIKTNSPLAHAIDTNTKKDRTICGITIVGDVDTSKKPDRNQKSCKKCLAYTSSATNA